MILNLSKYNDSDHFGNAKMALIDTLNKNLDQDYSYSTKLDIILPELCRMYGISVDITLNRKKSRRILRKYLACDVMNADALTYFMFVEGKFVTRHDIRDLIDHIGNVKYQELIANPTSNSSDIDIVAIALSNNFYSSREWKSVRYQAFRIYRNFCQCCGRKRSDGVVLHADHIKPRSLCPELALDITNIQILCEDCNIGKSNVDCTDWRS